MAALISLALENTAVAIAMAVFVYVVTRFWRNPPVAHLLWLLVLIKLVTPPIIGVHLLPKSIDASVQNHAADNLPPIVDFSQKRIETRPLQLAPQSSAAARMPPAADVRLSQLWNVAIPWLCWIWICGMAVCAAAAGARTVRFERRLRGTLPAAEPLQKSLREVAAILGIRRLPDLQYVESINVPMLWFAGRRPVIALPIALMRQLDESKAKLVLAHELAHLRRLDHWTRLFEMFVSIVYWWNPLVWLVRREIHVVEELCCDAWVRSALPTSESAYAELVLQAAELAGKSTALFSAVPASSFLHSSNLKARIDMIVNGRFAPRASKRWLVILAPVAAVLVFSFAAAEPPKTPATNSAQPPEKCETGFLAERFKYKVPFEIGETQHNGGKIEITAVWGTRPKIEVGGQYLVRGRYQLPPGQNRGKLYFYVTAEGTWGRIGIADLDLQTAELDKSNGDFALIHGMAGPGYFHLYLADPDSYSRYFDNVYFGTGETVLKK